MVPVITAQQALAQGVSAESLSHVADWNQHYANKSKDVKEKARMMKQASKLRETISLMTA